MNYFDFLEKYWDYNQFSPKVVGKIIPGRNGLYQEEETEFRNTAHWLLICKDLKTSREELSSFIERSLIYFLQNKPDLGTFPARNSSKDKSNGLIGSAWIIEALSEFIDYDKSMQNDIQSLCCDLLLTYPFNHEKGIWTSIVEPDGNNGHLDRTFNHQLWLNMAHQDLLSKHYDKEINKRTNSFINNLNKTLKLNNFGLVYHTIGIYPHYQRTLTKRIISSKYRKVMNKKEWGYHAFNLLALAKIYKRNHSLIIKNIVQRLLKPTQKKSFWQNQKNNKYGTTYNPVGIEVAVALDILNYPLSTVCNALNFHFQECFNVEKFTFEKSLDDATLNARLYEITHLKQDTKNKLIYCDNKNLWSFRDIT